MASSATSDTTHTSYEACDADAVAGRGRTLLPTQPASATQGTATIIMGASVRSEPRHRRQAQHVHHMQVTARWASQHGHWRGGLPQAIMRIQSGSLLCGSAPATHAHRPCPRSGGARRAVSPVFYGRRPQVVGDWAWQLVYFLKCSEPSAWTAASYLRHLLTRLGPSRGADRTALH